MRATLVIPTLNEAGSIATVLRLFRTSSEEANRTTLKEAPVDWDVVVVDGASTDGTAAIAAAEGARVVTERRRGYGRAYKTGFQTAEGDVIATADGDGTYPVEILPGLVRKLLDDGVDLISGNRMAYVTRRSMTTEHRIGNGVLNLFLRIAFHRFLRVFPGGTLADSQSGFWVFRREILERVTLREDGMAFSEELKLEAVLRGLKVVEVPIRYGERATPPKLQSWRDGVRNLLFLARKRFQVAREPIGGARGAVAAGQRPGRSGPG